MNKLVSSNSRTEDPMLPLTFDGWDNVDFMSLQLYNVIFTEDFGPFKKNESYNALEIDYVKGKVTIYDKEGKVLLSIEIKVCPK